MDQPRHDPRPQAAQALEGLYGRIAPHVFGHAAGMLDGEVTFSRVIALFHLYRHGPQSVATLAKAARLSATAGSRLVEGLVLLGVISRQESAVDRRRKDVTLTAQGQALVARLRQETAAAFETVLSSAPADLIADLALALLALEPWLPAGPGDGAASLGDLEISHALGLKAPAPSPVTR